jgi:hypothetical protein
VKIKEADHSSGGSTAVLWTLIHTKFIVIIEKASSIVKMKYIKKMVAQDAE